MDVIVAVNMSLFLLLSVICSTYVMTDLTIDSMRGLRSSHTDCRGLMNINDLDELIPFAALILSIPLAPGWLVSGKR